MGAIISIESEERIVVVSRQKIRLNILVEHPRSVWKSIRVAVNYDPAFELAPFEFPAITETNEANLSVLSSEVIVPNVSRDVRIGEISVALNGDTKLQYLPLLRVLHEEGFLEERVAEKLRAVGFEALRVGGRSQADVEAVHKKRPERRFEVEVARGHYDLKQFKMDLAKYLSLQRERKYHRLLIVLDSDSITESVRNRLRQASIPVSLILFRDLLNIASLYRDAILSSYEVIDILSSPGFVRPQYKDEQRRANLVPESNEVRSIRISVRFEPATMVLTEEASTIAQLKQTEVKRVFWTDELRSVDSFAQLVRLVKSFGQSINRASLNGAFAKFFQHVPGRKATDGDILIHCRDAVRLLKVLGLIDEGCFLTMDGDRFFKYLEGDPQRLSDFAARLLLLKGGWIAVATSVDNLRQGAYQPTSRSLLAGMIFDDLVEAGKAKRTDRWSILALIDCLVDMEILNQWDSEQKHRVDWERVYDILIRKSLT